MEAEGRARRARSSRGRPVTGGTWGAGPTGTLGFSKERMLGDVASDRARQGVEEGVLDAARRLTGVPLLPDARGTVCKASKLTDFLTVMTVNCDGKLDGDCV